MCLCGLILLYHSDLFLSHTDQADSSIEDPVLVGPKSKLMRGKYRLLSVQRNPKFELVLTDVAFKKAQFVKCDLGDSHIRSVVQMLFNISSY